MNRPRDLISAFKAIGLPMSMKTLHNYQTKGLLVLRRLPNNRRVMTDAEMRQIINSFSPGGSGKWHYDETKEIIQIK